MRCPKCQNRLMTTHTVHVGNVKLQRLKCSNRKCAAVVTAQTVIVEINPKHGNGIDGLVRKLGQGQIISPLSGASRSAAEGG